MESFDVLDNRIQALSLDAYEVYTLEKRVLTVEAKDGAVDSLDEASEKCLAIRLFKGRKSAFACASEATPFLERMVELAYNSLKVVEENETITLPDGGNRGEKGFAPRLEPASGLAGAGRNDKFGLALDLEKHARAFDRRITRVRDASFSEETATVRIKNSRGTDLQARRSRYELSLMVMAEEGTHQEMAWDSEQTTDLSQLEAKGLAERTSRKATGQLGGKPVATQKAAAVLDAMVAASFLGVLSSSFFGDQVQKSRSALRDKQGQRIYAPSIGLIDDGNLAGGFSSLPFDGEGVATRRNELVAGGVLKAFLFDLTSGAKGRVASTGNGLRSTFKEPPRVGATNLFIDRGRGTLEDLLEDMGRGFWIRDVIGLHTADVVTGDFSIGASGLWVENGRAASPVRGVTISGNLHEVLKRVVRVGEEVRWYHAFGAPPLLIESIDIGGT